jgi:hypothetical protein
MSVSCRFLRHCSVCQWDLTRWWTYEMYECIIWSTICWNSGKKINTDYTSICQCHSWAHRPYVTHGNTMSVSMYMWWHFQSLLHESTDQLYLFIGDQINYAIIYITSCSSTGRSPIPNRPHSYMIYNCVMSEENLTTPQKKLLKLKISWNLSD